MSSEPAQTNWTEPQTPGTEWARTLTGFAASAGLDAANAELVFAAKEHPESDAELFRVTKSGGEIVVLSSSSCTVNVGGAVNVAAAGLREIWFQLWLVDTITSKVYKLHYGKISLVPWPPS